MFVPDALVEIGRMRQQELLRERERDSLIAQACQSAPNHWRQVLARSLHALAARIESSPAPPIAASPVPEPAASPR